jgi:hypothetical protein
MEFQTSEIAKTVATLAALFAPYIALVGIFTEWLTGLTGWQGNASKLTASITGLVFGGLIALAYFIPSVAPYVGTFFFLVTAVAGPSGGHDLIVKFAGRVGNGDTS